MENINAYFASKITFIRYLLVILISSISIGVLAEAQNPKSIDGSWVNSGGRDHESAQNLRYTFEVTEAGEFDLRLESDTSNPCIDTVLYLLDTNGLKNSNDDWTTRVPQSPHSDCKYNSRIITSNLSNGIYTLVAGTYSSGESGDFVISARSRSPNGSFNLEKSDPEENKSIGSKCSGQWKSSGGQSYKSNRNPNFDLIVTAKEKVTVNLSSSVDTFLYLLNKDSLRVIEKNDDIRPGNYNSRIEQVLDPGDYVLVAATWGNNQTGDFNLIVTSTDGNSELKCSPGGEDEGEGGNSSQPPLSLGEDVTITWRAKREERFYQREATGGSINLAYTSSNSTDFPVVLRSGEVRYTNSGSAIIKASHIVNGIEQTAQYILTVEKADQQPLESIERITKTFAPDLAFTPDVSGGSTDNQVTFQKAAGPDNIVSLDNNPTTLEITGTGTVVILATEAGNENYNDVSRFFWLTVNKAKPWIKIEGITNDKFIKNGTSGEIHIPVEVVIGQGEDEKTIEVNESDFTFDYANNTQDLLGSVEIKDSKIFAKKIGRASIKVSVPESDNYFAAEKEFVLEVRPQNVEFNQQNLSSNNITKQCGQDVDVDLMIDNKPLEQALQNTGSSDDILVFASSNSSVAQVNSQTGVVTPVGTGTATISATLFGDSELADSYNLTVNKGVQPIEFQEKDTLKKYGDEISNNSIKNPIKGAQPDGSITYSIKQQDGTLFSINSSTGEVTLNPGSKLPVTYSATIEAKRRGNNCYEAATASYKINLYNAVVKFPEPGETADKEYNIQFSSSSSTSSNNIKLYYTNTPAGKLNDNTIVKPIRGSEYDNKIDISQGFYRWDTSGLPEGNYYIIAGTDGGIDTANVDDCDHDGSKGCFIAKNPLIIEHDHGLAMDCSGEYNYPSGSKSAPMECYGDTEVLPLINSLGEIVFIGNDEDSLKPKSNKNFKKIYPSWDAFLGVKNNGEVELLGGLDDQKNVSIPRSPKKIYSFEETFILLYQNNELFNLGSLRDSLINYDPENLKQIIENDWLIAAVRPLKSGSFDEILKQQDFSKISGFSANNGAKSALKEDGSIITWGVRSFGGELGPQDSGYSMIYPMNQAFTAVKEDGSAIFWPDTNGVKMSKRTQPVKGKYIQIINPGVWATQALGLTENGFAHLWGQDETVSNLKPSDLDNNHNIQSIYGIGEEFDAAFAALKYDGSIVSWGSGDRKSEYLAPEKDGLLPYTKIYSNTSAFAAITAEGRIQSWGDNDCGGSNSNAPIGSGYIAIYSTYCSFVAVKADGSYSTWGKMGEKTGTLSPKQIEITPFDFSYDAEDKILDFSVRYTAYERKISSLTLVMYHEDKWVFNGLSDIKGLRYPPDTDTKPKAEPIKGWTFQDYGEFNMFFYDLSKADLGKHFYDGEEKTDTAVYLTWSSNETDGRGTFESSPGFLESAPDNGVKLFKTSFKLNDDINFDKSCINFFVDMPSTGIGRDYETRLQSLVITKSESGELIPELGKQYSRLPGDDQAWSPCKANPNTSNSDNSGG